ncbi:NnrS family protein [Marivita sp. S0852]|uniref:NnrS family protein n=1 Tax=Marivita sp. S0852 TaxID=3373893 RepID=UPI003981FF8A
MSCSTSAAHDQTLPSHWLGALGHEGYRLFFPLGAVYAALWPLLWVLVLGFNLPLAHTVPPSLWHAHEMLIGAFGAGLIGFLTIAVPEWTDTAPPRGRVLWTLAALWGVGRMVGLLGWDGLGLIGALADLAWMLALLGFVLHLSWQKRTDRLLAFALWLGLLIACTVVARWSFAMGDLALATKALHLLGLAYLGLLGLALARISVPITNLVLDPSEETSPYRPHPGRLHLASGLVLVAMAGEVAGLSAAVTGYLCLAAGAAFMDRVAEGFIGREMLRSEILMLTGSAFLAGLGLILMGTARLGASWSEMAGVHVALMGGLGLSLYAVYSMAGLLHTHHPLCIPRRVRAGALLLVLSVVLRVGQEFGLDLPGPLHALAALTWAAAFGVWLYVYWPMFTKVERVTPSIA